MTNQQLINLDVAAKLKCKFVDEVWQLYIKMTRGYYPDTTFLSNEGDVIDLLENYPELDVSLKYIINYYLTTKWQDK